MINVSICYGRQAVRSMRWLSSFSLSSAIERSWHTARPRWLAPAEELSGQAAQLCHADRTLGDIDTINTLRRQLP